MSAPAGKVMPKTSAVLIARATYRIIAISLNGLRSPAMKTLVAGNSAPASREAPSAPEWLRCLLVAPRALEVQFDEVHVGEPSGRVGVRCERPPTRLAASPALHPRTELDAGARSASDRPLHSSGRAEARDPSGNALDPSHKSNPTSRGRDRRVQPAALFVRLVEQGQHGSDAAALRFLERRARRA